MKLGPFLWVSLAAVAAIPTWSSAQPAVARAGSDATSQTALVYIPYDKLRGPELRSDQSVLVPYAEFLKLRKSVEGQPNQPDFRPMASLSQAGYTGSMQGDVALLDAEFTIEVLARPADRLSVALPFPGASIERATATGPDCTLSPLEESAPGVRVSLHGPGQRVVKLRLAAPVQVQEAVKRLDFGIPRAAAASLKLTVPEDVVLASIPNMLPSTLTRQPKSGVEISASVGSSGKIVLGFRPRAETKAGKAEARFSCAEDIQVKLGARTASATVQVKTTFASGSSDSFGLQLPEGVQLLGVSGPFVKNWAAPANDGLVSVSLVREMSEPFDVSFDVAFGQESSATQVRIPQFRVPGAVRESGSVTVVPEEGVSVWPESLSGLEAGNTPAGSSAGARVFRFGQTGWSLVLSRRPMQARVRSDAMVLYEVMDDFVRLKARYHITVSGRGIFGLSFDVPEGYELREAGPPEVVSGFRQQKNRVEVNFRSEQPAGVDVDVRMQRARNTSDTKVLIEPIVVSGAEEDSGNVVVAAPLALRATETNSSGLQATDVRTLSERLKPLLSADLVPALGYHYFAPAYHAAAAVERQRTRLACETALLASITPSLMRVDATLNYLAEFSAAGEFQLLVPASAGEDVRFDGADIKEKIPTALDRKTSPSADMTTWTVRLQRRVLGPYKLAVSFDVPLPAADPGKKINVTVPSVRALNVARETGFVGVSRGENLEVRVARSEALETRDTKELPQGLSSASLGFQFFDPDKQQLELELVRHELEPVLTMLIRRMHIETVVNDQREAVHEAIFEIQNNSEQYLALKLPKEMEIWSAFVRGAPVRPTKRSDGASLIELTKSQSRDDAFRVRLIMRETLGGGGMGTFGTLRFLSPEPEKSSQPEKIPVLRMTRKLFLPRAWRYVDFGGSMHSVSGERPPWLEMPWMQTAAEKVLSDMPASFAGGAAKREMHPHDTYESPGYNSGETDDEKRARLKGSALEIPIVRDGLEFQFSKLSGVGDITVDYFKRKPLMLIQAAVAFAAFVLVLLLSRGGRRPSIGFVLMLLLFIAASLAEHLAARFVNPAFAGSIAAFVICIIMWIAHAGYRKTEPEQPELESSNLT